MNTVIRAVIISSKRVISEWKVITLQCRTAAVSERRKNKPCAVNGPSVYVNRVKLVHKCHTLHFNMCIEHNILKLTQEDFLKTNSILKQFYIEIFDLLCNSGTISLEKLPL